MDDGGCGSECRVIGLQLTRINPWLLVTAQWPWHDAVYTIYRILVAIYFLVWLIISGLFNEGAGVKFLIYLSHWGFIIQTFTLLIQAFSATVATTLSGRVDPGDDRVPWYLQLQWAFYNISTIGALIISILYWGLIYDPSIKPTASGIHIHAINSIYALIDLYITATPIRLLHFYYGTIYIVIYVIFTAIYPALGGTDPEGNNYIYNELDFMNNPGMSVVWAAVLTFIVVPVVWLLIFGLFKLRITIYEMVYGLKEIRFRNTEVYMSSPPAPTVVYYTTAPAPIHCNYRSMFVSDHLRSNPMFNYRY